MLQGWFLSDKLNIHGVLYIIEVKNKKLTEVLNKLWKTIKKMTRKTKLNFYAKPVFDKIGFFILLKF